MNSRRIRAIIDRYEDDSAVLLLGDDCTEVLWPANALPDNACEGAVVWIDISVDAAATTEARNTADTLIDRLKRRQQ